MSYEAFAEEIKKQIEDRIGQGRTVYVKESVKNNGKKKKGLVFSDPSVNVSPAIFLEEFYERYLQGCSISELADRILEFYETVKVTEPLGIERLTDFAYIRQRLVYGLVNRDKNRELLKEVPYRNYLDLAIVFFVLVDTEQKDRFGTMLVRREYLKWWGVPEEDLFLAASENTGKLLPAEFMPLKTLLEEMNPMVWEETYPDTQTEETMYVLTNSVRSYGAAALLYENCLHRIADFIKQDFYVLPSSVHEVIIVPVDCAPSLEELCMMVREINETQVKDEEVLSDTAYWYDRKEGILRAGV